MEDDEDVICHMCPTTDREQGHPLRFVDWLAARVCDECAVSLGVEAADAA